jgi:hypothetical protein
LKKWKEEGLKEIYFFIHSNSVSYCPELAQQFLDKITFLKPEIEIKPPSSQGSLF